MWPLIIPPIVLVLSLGFLVWFLSKKSADPALQERLLGLESQSKSRRFLFVFPRDWGLRLLERLIQRLKLVSLKFHNQFQEASNLLKRKREAVNEAEALSQEGVDTSLLTTEDKEGFWDRWHRRHRATFDTEPVTSGENAPHPAQDAERIVVTNTTPSEERPSRLSGLKKRVNALVTSDSDGPFSRQKRAIVPPKKLLSEEELIDRIAKNPKDAASYEELGDYYLASENLEDAKACYRQVIKLSPLNREVKDKVRKLERLLVQRERSKH